MAEERDRWSVDWQVADLDQEGEHLLDLLERAEELRAAVPGMRVPVAGARTPDEGATCAAVLIGITDRRVLVVGRWPVADADQRSCDDWIGGGADTMTSVTAVVGGGARDRRLDLPGGDTELDLDPAARDRLWAHVDGW